MLRIRYMSDLHLEHSNFTINHEDCDVIVLAGDTCSYIEDYYFALHKIPNTIPVIIILGNHEYENEEFTILPQKIREFLRDSSFTNVHLLHNEYLDIGDVRIIGSTLWSDCKGYHNYMGKKSIQSIQVTEEKIQSGILNYLRLYHQHSTHPSQYLTVDMMKKEFEKSYQFIQDSLNTSQKCVVVTHFAPLFEISGKHINKPISSFWANEIPELMGKPLYWIHGHLHEPYPMVVAGTKIISNPRGVSKIFNGVENKAFQMQATIHV